MLKIWITVCNMDTSQWFLQKQPSKLTFSEHHTAAIFPAGRDYRYFLQDTLAAHGRWPAANGSCATVLAFNFRNALDVLHLYLTDHKRQGLLVQMVAWIPLTPKLFTGDHFEKDRVSLMWNVLGWRETESAGWLLKVGVRNMMESLDLLVKKDLLVGQPMDRYLGRNTPP